MFVCVCMCVCVCIYIYICVCVCVCGPGVACATNRTVLGSIPGGVTWDFFRGSFRQNHVSWGRLSLWKWVPGISPAGALGWRTTTLVVPKVETIRCLNLPGTPRANSASRGITLLYIYIYISLKHPRLSLLCFSYSEILHPKQCLQFWPTHSLLRHICLDTRRAIYTTPY